MAKDEMTKNLQHFSERGSHFFPGAKKLKKSEKLLSLFSLSRNFIHITIPLSFTIHSFKTRTINPQSILIIKFVKVNHRIVLFQQVC
jgi:hypothetical protein